MNKNIDAMKMDKLQFDLKCAVDIVSAIQVAIEYGPYDSKEWNAAFARAAANLQEVSNTISAVVAGKDVEA